MRYLSLLLLSSSVVACEEAPQNPAEAAQMAINTRRSRAEEFCDRADDCDNLALLFSTEECSLQAHQKLERLFVKSSSSQNKAESVNGLFDAPRCHHCITSLTCSGMTEVADGLIAIRNLCPNCSGHFQSSAQPAACFLSGIAKKRPEPPAAEEASLADSPETTTPIAKVSEQSN